MGICVKPNNPIQAELISGYPYRKETAFFHGGNIAFLPFGIQKNANMVYKRTIERARRTRTAGIFSILDNLDNFQKIVYF